ncbi:MAG: hypothetical protein AB8H79_22905 [Myxococcota bacterium]
MSFLFEKRAAARLLDALENGTLSTQDTAPLAEEADPALLYLIFAFLRANYHSGHSASDGVLGRIVDLCGASPVAAKNARKGEKDAIVEWFAETYDYREIDREDFIDEVVEKLEG